MMIKCLWIILLNMTKQLGDVMIALDTNILARAIFNDDDKQSPLAKRFIEKQLHKGIYVSAFVVIELVWLMKKRLKKQRICAIVEQLMQTEGFVVGNKHLLALALLEYRKGTADFTDYVILLDGRESVSAPLVTWDKKLVKHPDVRMFK